MNEAVASQLALAVHVVALVVAAALTVVALVRRDRLVAGRTVALACASAAAWAGHVAWFEASGLSRGLLLWLPAVGATCGLLWTVARRMTDATWRPSRAVVALLVAEPLVVAAWQVLLGPHAVVSVGAIVSFGPLFAVHTAYCFALLLLAVLALARRSNDREGAVRLQAAALQWGAVAALVTEAMRLQLTDVAAVAALTVFVGAGVRGPARPVVPPSPDRLLDDLGALVLAFDAGRRLVEWNRPAELLLALAGREPRVGDAVADVLGVDLPFSDGTVLEVPAVGGTTRLTGFCHALYDAGDGGGWSVVLRRIGRPVPSAPPSAPAAGPAVPALRSLPEHDAETGLLTPLGLVEQLGVHLGGGAAHLEDTPPPRAVVAIVEPAPGGVARDARTLGRWAEAHASPVGVARWTSGRLAVVALAERDARQAEAIARDVRAAVSADARIEVLLGDGDLAAVLSLIGEAEGRLAAD